MQIYASNAMLEKDYIVMNGVNDLDLSMFQTSEYRKLGIFVKRLQRFRFRQYATGKHTLMDVASGDVIYVFGYPEMENREIDKLLMDNLSKVNPTLEEVKFVRDWHQCNLIDGTMFLYDYLIMLMKWRINHKTDFKCAMRNSAAKRLNKKKGKLWKEELE